MNYLSGECGREKQNLINVLAWDGEKDGLGLQNEWFFQACCVERLILHFCIVISLAPCEPLLNVSRNPLQEKVHKPSPVT